MKRLSAWIIAVTIITCFAAPALGTFTVYIWAPCGSGNWSSNPGLIAGTDQVCGPGAYAVGCYGCWYAPDAMYGSCTVCSSYARTNETGQARGNIICANSSANLKSGNLYFSQDAGLLSLSYNSIDAHAVPIGIGWTHSYNIYIDPQSAGTLVLRNGDGNNIYFTLSNGVYYPDPSSGDTSQIIKNADGTYTQTTKGGIVYSFNSTGKLVSITDRNGNTTTLAYDSNNNLAGITDSSGRTTAITLTGGLITSITDAGGNQYTLAYNSSNYLTSITDPTNHSWQYTYDTNGHMLTKTDPAGYKVAYTLDTNGMYQLSTDPDGKNRALNYNASANTSTFTEKDGGVWTFQYDPTLHVKTSKTDPLGNITKYTYDANRNLLTETDPAGNKTTYTYDTSSNMTSVKDALGNLTSYTYNSFGQVTSKTDPSGNVTTYLYDAKGNLLSITDPTGAKVSYGYDSRGNVISVTDAKKQVTAFVYDQYNNVTSVTDPLGAVTTFAYDVMGNMLSKTDRQGGATNYQYNSLNQLIQMTDPLGNVAAYTYDPDGNRASMTDANGNTTNYAYRYNGQVKQITDALGKITALSYGGTGCPSCGGGVDKITAITDAKSNTTAYQYDTAGHLIKETDPLGYITSYAYDTRGNLITKTDANGNSISYSYDALNRLIQKTYPDGVVDAFQYDARGNLTYAGNRYIAYNFSYDALNRLTSVTDSNARTIQYTYDVNSNRLTLKDPLGGQTQYGYNPINRLNSLQNGQGQLTFNYDTLGRRTGLNYPNGLGNTYTYDAASNLSSLTLQNSSSTLTSTIYSYDKVGNRLSAITTPSSENAVTQPPQQYIYYADNALAEDGTNTYTYAYNGNLLSKTNKTTGAVTNYTWDYENRLIQVQLPNGTIAQYKYDPFGRRIQKNVNGAVTTYLYDNQEILFEYDQNGNVQRAYTHGLRIDEPLMVNSNGSTYYYHADALGSVASITDSTGTVVQKNIYDAFGNIQSGNTLSQPYAFTGREYDAETGLYYYRNRYADMQLGRFISKDPIGFGGGINKFAYVNSVGKPLSVQTNLYQYASNNPVNRIDPYGLFDNPLPNLPSFSDAFPNWKFTAPVADIVAGSIETGGAIATGVAAVVISAAGPQYWWLAPASAPVIVPAFWDGIDRIRTGVENLSNYQNNSINNRSKSKCP